MGTQVQTETGEHVTIVMGCYGLGVTRTLDAIVEAHHDDDGIQWPISIAPFEVAIIPVNPKDEAQIAAAEQLYEGLGRVGIEVLIDDREERSGVKFKDADLIGYPVRLVVGRALAEGNVEVVLRRDKSSSRAIPLGTAVEEIAALVSREKSALEP